MIDPGCSECFSASQYILWRCLITHYIQDLNGQDNSRACNRFVLVTACLSVKYLIIRRQGSIKTTNILCFNKSKARAGESYGQVIRIITKKAW